ncbi:hypothetical protein D3C74_394920 [compost metagenome]
MGNAVELGISGFFTKAVERISRAGFDTFQATFTVLIVNAEQNLLWSAALVFFRFPHEAIVRADIIAGSAADAFLSVKFRQQPGAGTA